MMPSIRSLLQTSALLASSLWAASTSAQNSTSTSTSSTTACNNSPDLCGKSYGNITHLGAHDSAFVANATNSWTSSGNQFYNSPTQLSAGVRLLSAQVHKTNNSAGATEWHLCHTDCDLLDAGKLSDWLTGIKNWMDSHPNDVVTILLVNSDDASASELHAEYETAGLNSMSYTPTSQTQAPTTWPTLDELISNSTRVVNFVASLNASENSVAPYLMDEFTFLFENPYQVTAAANFSCTPDRPTSLSGQASAAIKSNRLFMMNHFLDQTQALFNIVTPNVAMLGTTNGADTATVGTLGNHAQTCSGTYGQAPNFMLVDYFNVGPAIAVADTLNGVSRTVTGRTSLPSTVVDTKAAQQSATSGAGSQSGSGSGSAFAAVVAVTVAVLASSW